jgi:hypothetical protein
MPTELISLDEASFRLEKSRISARAFAELLVKSPPLLLGILPRNEVRDLVDLSRVTSFRAEPENVVTADNVKWTDIKLDWRQLRDGFERRGCGVSWSWPSDITPEMLARARQPSPTLRHLGDPRPLVRSMRATSAVPRPTRRARREWFDGAVFTGAIPPSGQPPRGKRGPKSGKRENTAAAICKGLKDEIFTVNALRAMPEKELADRYGVSRDTARKARNDALQSFVEDSSSTNDK